MNFVSKLSVAKSSMLGDHPFKTSANFHNFWPLPPYHRHYSKMLMKGFFILMYCDLLTISPYYVLNVLIMFFRNNGKIGPSISMENPNVITVKLEHVLVAVGFCLGFGFVFCIAIVYYKVKPLQRFNILNNQTGMNTKKVF